MSNKADKAKSLQLIISSATLAEQQRKSVQEMLNRRDILDIAAVAAYNKSLLEYKQRIDKYNELFDTSIAPLPQFVAKYRRLDNFSIC